MHYIYHIPEKEKIGVSVNVEHRMLEHGWEGFYEILEQHEDGWLAGDRERELQKEYGYKVDKNHYMVSYTNRINASSLAGKRNVESGHLKTIQSLGGKALKGTKQNKMICPHCGKSGGHAMKRWHFDNCKKK